MTPREAALQNLNTDTELSAQIPQETTNSTVQAGSR